MSVITTFDEEREKAKEYIDKVIKSIHICLNQDTWGYNDMSDSYIDELGEILIKLLKIKRKL